NKKLYTLPAQKWSQRIGQELSRIFLREGISEDLSTLETTQEGLKSGALPYMVLSDQEIAIRHQYRVIEDILRGASAPWRRRQRQAQLGPAPPRGEES